VGRISIIVVLCRTGVLNVSLILLLKRPGRRLALGTAGKWITRRLAAGGEGVARYYGAEGRSIAAGCRESDPSRQLAGTPWPDSQPPH